MLNELLMIEAEERGRLEERKQNIWLLSRAMSPEKVASILKVPLELVLAVIKEKSCMYEAFQN